MQDLQKEFFKFKGIFPSSLPFLASWNKLKMLYFKEIWNIFRSDSFLSIENVNTLNFSQVLQLFHETKTYSENKALFKNTFKHLLVRISFSRPEGKLTEFIINNINL